MASIELTRQELALIRRLIRNEAKEIGYGTKYHWDNRKDWPRSLRMMENTMAKLRRAMAEM